MSTGKPSVGQHRWDSSDSDPFDDEEEMEILPLDTSEVPLVEEAPSAFLNTKGGNNEVLPQYVLNKGFSWVKRLGEGGFATVHLLKRGNQEEFVACKIVDLKKVNADWAQVYLIREPKTASKMLHPNIIKTFDVVKTTERMFVFMEFASGGSVNDMIHPTPNDFKSQELRLVMKWLCQTASAIKYIHDKGYAHRDIKPENLLLTQYDDIKVADFGLVAIIETMKGGKKYRKLSNTVTGTIEYRAPEIETDQKYDARKADTFSLGISLFEMLTGFLPYYDEDPKKVLKKKQSLELPRSLPPGVEPIPARLRTLMDSMLDPNPNARPKMSRILHDLQKMMTSPEIISIIWSKLHDNLRQ
jgi:serine/threonine protein kinase